MLFLLSRATRLRPGFTGGLVETVVRPCGMDVHTVQLFIEERLRSLFLAKIIIGRTELLDPHSDHTRTPCGAVSTLDRVCTSGQVVDKI